MACYCKKEIETKLLARFKEQRPEATEHNTALQGYALLIQDNALVQKGCMEIKATAIFPLKKGGAKAKTISENMVFTFCPFCGTKYDTEKN